MSIAVSALVRPSRVHRFLLGACALVQCGVAVALAAGAPLHYPGGPLALLPALAATGLFAALARNVKTHRIDISGTGELRVTVQQDVRAGAAAEPAAGVLLLPGSVVWPLLMVLHYGEPGGVARVLLVWRDAVDAGAWRALAVALGTLGSRARTGAERGRGGRNRHRDSQQGSQRDMFSDDRTRK